MLPSALAFLLFVGLPAAAHAHGGTYRGAGDTVPSSGPSSGPRGPSGVGGTAPASPGTTSAGLPPSVARTAGGDASALDGRVWELWWGYNNAAYLDIKSAVHFSDLRGGSAAFFLGRRSRDTALDRIVPTREAIEERVVPALLRVLDRERDADIVTGALVALAKIGEARPGSRERSARISAFLADRNQEIAETAAISLGILEDRGSIPVLIDLLFDRPAARERLEKSEIPWRTRAFAAYGLGLIGNRIPDESLRLKIFETLREALAPSGVLELATPDIAVACLTAIGLVPLSTDVPPEGVAASARMEQLQWLRAFSKRPDLDHLVQAHVPTAIARLVEGAPASWGLKGEICRSWLLRLSEGGMVDRTVQQSCVLALGSVSEPTKEPVDQEVRARLLEISRDSPNIELRRFALIALAQIASRASGEEEGVVATTIRDQLIRRLEDDVGEVRAWAALALGVLGQASSVGGSPVEERTDALLLDALVKARVPWNVAACAIACGIRGQRGAGVAMLRKLREVRDEEARGYVALALGMAGVSEALEAIREVIRGSKYRPELLRQAAVSLGLLGDKDLVPELIDMLVHASSLSAQASIAQGLGAIGDARSLDPLIRMLEDGEKTPRARAFAAVALGIVSDKEPRPWNAKLSIGVNYRANTTTLTDGRGSGILEIL